MTPIAWYFYPAFIAFVLVMLLIDLKFFHSQEHEPSMKESAAWVAIWVTLGLLFGALVFFWRGAHNAGQYFAGYLIEYSLSVDNMFVFVVIFSYFRIPLAYQHRVLFFGILGAIALRGIFIAIGVALINIFSWTIYLFGGFLVYTAVRMVVSTEEMHPERSRILTYITRRFPTTNRYEGQKLLTVENGRRVATPLFLTLVFIDVVDLIFAVDSIPAIFAVTRDPFIVLSSNVFAVLGLRALYFLLAGAVNRFHLLKYGLAVVLGFVGVKMLAEAANFHVPIVASLGFIVATLAVTVVLSLLIPLPEQREAPPEHREPATGYGSTEEPAAERGHELPR